MKPILEMNDEELYQFYLDNKNRDKAPKIIAVISNNSITLLDPTQIKRYTKRSIFIDDEPSDIEADILGIEDDVLICKIKESEEDDE